MPKATRKKYKVKESYVGANGGLHTQGKTGAKIASERDSALAQRAQALQALPSDVRVAIDREVQGNGALPDDLAGVTMDVDYPGGDAGWVSDDDDDRDEAPEISHEGGEFGDKMRAAFELTNIAYAKQRFRRPWDLRTRRERQRALHQNWEAEMPALVDAYLGWKHEGPGRIQINQRPDFVDYASRPHDHGLRHSEVPSDGETTSGDTFEVCAVGTFVRTPKLQVFQRKEEPANVALIRVGLLGCSPLQPSVAFGLPTLELYHRLRRRHPQLGIQPMVRALCDLHDVNYQTSLREQFSIAFDAYLNILRRVQVMVDQALGRGDAHWRVKNSCPPCNFKLEDEPTLIPSRMGCIDGNNSAKRVASAGTEDQREFQSSYFLTREQVNMYKNEVRGRRAGNHNDEDLPVADAPWAPDPDSPGDPTDGDDGITPCTERWKASAAEHTKKALDVYDITGIFGGTCRHGLITLFCEMVRSGELAKYPLAITDHELDAHDDDDAAKAFDIGCAFKTTVECSPLVGPKAAKRRLQVFVNAFHGWAHNRLCQLSHHPLYRPGVGLEDLEGMERLFSSSNGVARVVRYATHFHWKQAIDLHFQQWDADKYSTLSRFLLNNYRQALALIRDHTADVQSMMQRLEVDEAAIQRWLVEEDTFLRNLKEEPEERILECAYVEALRAQAAADKKWQAAASKFIDTPLATGGTSRDDIRKTKRAETLRRNAMIALQTANRVVADLEFKLEIGPSWTPEDARYKEVLEYLRAREFHQALNKVQQLVVQRLLEMSKANIAGMGYKVRTSIWKHLKSRGKAIRTALTNYNSLAAKQKPPAPLLEWKDIVKYGFLSEFDIIRHSHSRTDFVAQPWMSPSNREVANKLFKIIRAREEITRLNVEIPRLRSFMFEEERVYLDAMTIQEEKGRMLLAAEIHEQYRTRHRINAVHHATLNVIEGIPGFSGVRGGGTPVNAGNADWEDINPSGQGGGDDDDHDMEEDLQAQCADMGDLLEALVIED